MYIDFFSSSGFNEGLIRDTLFLREGILVIRLFKSIFFFFLLRFLKAYAFEDVYVKGFVWIRKISKVLQMFKENSVPLAT